MNTKKTLKEGLKQKKSTKAKEPKFSSQKAQENAMKDFSKMSRGDMPL
jgi:hypothetical protein|tara:strand:+ start:59 stop:202 length:144 start_codon:yes stop_codon:yes gene_type:complete